MRTWVRHTRRADSLPQRAASQSSRGIHFAETADVSLRVALPTVQSSQIADAGVLSSGGLGPGCVGSPSQRCHKRRRVEPNDTLVSALPAAEREVQRRIDRSLVGVRITSAGSPVRARGHRERRADQGSSLDGWRCPSRRCRGGSRSSSTTRWPRRASTCHQSDRRAQTSGDHTHRTGLLPRPAKRRHAKRNTRPERPGLPTGGFVSSLSDRRQRTGTQLMIAAETHGPALAYRRYVGASTANWQRIIPLAERAQPVRDRHRCARPPAPECASSIRGRGQCSSWAPSPGRVTRPSGWPSRRTLPRARSCRSPYAG